MEGSEISDKNKGQDASLHGLSVGLGMAITIAASVIAFAYFATPVHSQPPGTSESSTGIISSISQDESKSPTMANSGTVRDTIQQVVIKPVYIDRIRYLNQTIEVEKPMYINRTIEVEKPVYIDRTVEVEKPVYVEVVKEVEKPIYIEKEKIVYVPAPNDTPELPPTPQVPAPAIPPVQHNQAEHDSGSEGHANRGDNHYKDDYKEKHKQTQGKKQHSENNDD